MSINARARALAQRGEERAAAYVTELGWRVVDRNWRCREGELDLVAHDPDSDTLVFVEVKTRSGTGFGHPLETITYAKAARLRGLAMAWLRDRDAHARNIRVDAIGLVLPPDGGEDLTHVRGIGER
ncbi:YraN family protein [Tessaracoccus sp. OS52]|uniref:YraN family protein n=1 Tax=Tessaracoccus sp. OS52 TaxID=2886691 RepID=UPI001D107741|nr:YraN family protein [Tessaracoccus sp. OS52]MCC2593235.1 YraN family protein [Tessaracoccus sp. OS52]